MNPSTRPRHIIPVVVAMLVLVLLAGCIGGSGEQSVDPVDNASDDDLDLNVSNGSGSQVVFNRSRVPTAENSTVHTHNYWDGSDTWTLIDGMEIEGFSQEWVAQECQKRPTATCPPAGRRQVVIPVKPDADRPNFVYPGTGKITFELDWDGSTQTPITVCSDSEGQLPAKIRCRDPESASGVQFQHHTFEEPGTWTIEGPAVDKESRWDVPHTSKSKWRFVIHAETCGDEVVESGSLLRRCYPETDISSFTVTLKVHRGDKEIPIEPPHLDFFQDRDKVTVLPMTELDRCSQDGADMSTFWSWRASRQDRDFPVCTFGSLDINPHYPDGDSDSPVIPPGTQVVRVTLEWSNDNSDPLTSPLQLKYRSAAENWNEPWVAVPDGSTSCSGTTCTYEIPIENAKMPDSLYATRTVWEFGVFAANGPQDPQPPALNPTISAEIVAEAGSS